MQNSDFWTRIANLYGSQISPAVLCLQCSVSSIRITSLHGSQPSCVVFGCNRATFGQEKQVSMSPRHNLSLCACKIAWLAPELLVSMDPSPHLWFLHAKQRLWTRITNLYGSQTSPVVLCMQYSVISTRITCLYGSQTLSMVFGCTTATFGAELQVSMVPRHDLSVCGFKTAWLASEELVSMGPSLHVWFLDAKQRLLDQNNKSLRVPDKSCRFMHGKQQL